MKNTLSNLNRLLQQLLNQTKYEISRIELTLFKQRKFKLDLNLNKLFMNN